MGVLPIEVVAADEQVVLRRQLVIAAPERVVLKRVGWQGNGLSSVRRRPDDDRVRLALILVREEVVHLVLDDRTAERPAHLLIGIRQHLSCVCVR